jgi:hypothetical protein
LHRELAIVNRVISRAKLQNALIEDGELKLSRDKTSIPQRHKGVHPEGLRADAAGKATDLLMEVAS